MGAWAWPGGEGGTPQKNNPTVANVQIFPDAGLGEGGVISGTDGRPPCVSIAPNADHPSPSLVVNRGAQGEEEEGAPAKRQQGSPNRKTNPETATHLHPTARRRPLSLSGAGGRPPRQNRNKKIIIILLIMKRINISELGRRPRSPGKGRGTGVDETGEKKSLFNK